MPMKKSDIKELSEVELQRQARDLRLEVFQLRQSHAQIGNSQGGDFKVHQLTLKRRQVARIETRLTQLHRAKAKAAVPAIKA